VYKNGGVTIDRLEQYLQDYNDGILSISTLTSRLSCDETAEIYAQTRKTTRVVSKLSDYISPKLLNPQDIVCERERLQEVSEVVQRILTALPDGQREIFKLTIVDGRTQKEAGEILGCSHQNISKHFNKTMEFILDTFDLTSLRPMLLPASSTKEIGGAQYKVRYPSDWLSERSTGGHMGKRKWIVDIHCEVDGYLDDAFGDKLTCCAKCEHCVNKVMQKRVNNE
jgi:hypothetical protein